MPKATHQKIKLLMLMEILRRETDEQTPISTSQLCSRLQSLGISCDRRTLSKDISLLNEFGFQVMSRMVGHEKGYFIDDRGFTLPELKVLMDAVQAATFITTGKTLDLVDKIARLGGTHRGELLKGNLVRFNTRKHRNESIFYNIAALETALAGHQRASFLYYHLNERGERVFRNGNRRYLVDPAGLVYQNDNYYLMAYEQTAARVFTYRVDRMEQVWAEQERICPEAEAAIGSLPEHMDQAFRMFGGPVETVTLRFDESLIGVVFDKFGESTRMIRQDDNTCLASVKVQVSPTFWGWLAQFPGLMKIQSPEYLMEEYREWVRKILE